MIVCLGWLKQRFSGGMEPDKTAEQPETIHPKLTPLNVWLLESNTGSDASAHSWWPFHSSRAVASPKAAVTRLPLQ